MSTFQNLHVRGLPRHINDAILESFFAQYSPVQSAAVMRNPSTGESKGFGFVLFHSEEVGRMVHHTLNGVKVILGGKEVTLSLQPSRHVDAQVSESNVVYFRNIPCALTVQQFAEIVGLPMRVISVHSGAKDLSYLLEVAFHDVRSAREAIRALNGVYLCHSTVPTMAKFKDSKRLNQLSVNDISDGSRSQQSLTPRSSPSARSPTPMSDLNDSIDITTAVKPESQFYTHNPYVSVLCR